MARGTAVEHAINEWVEGKAEPEDLLDVAKSKYDDEIDEWITTVEDYTIASDEVRASLPGLVECAYKYFSGIFNEFRKPELQHSIEVYLPGVTRKIIGKLDCYLPKENEIRDCKVVASTPKKGQLSQAYKIQGAIYRKAKNDANVVFDFIINNKTAKAMPIKLTDEDYVFGISYATVAAKLIEELEVCTDTKRIMQIMTFPDIGAMYDMGEKREAAKEWGIFMP